MLNFEEELEKFQPSLEIDQAEEDFSAAEGALDVDEVDATEDEGEAPVRSKAKAVTQEEELPSVEGKRKERDALADAMAAFLARGGKIQAVEPVED